MLLHLPRALQILFQPGCMSEKCALCRDSMPASMSFTASVSMSGCCSAFSFSVPLEHILCAHCANGTFGTTGCLPRGALPTNRKPCPLQSLFLQFHNATCFLKTIGSKENQQHASCIVPMDALTSTFVRVEARSFDIYFLTAHCAEVHSTSVFTIRQFSSLYFASSILHE